MGKLEPLGIKRIEALHYYVRDLERSRAFYSQKLGFQEIGRSSQELEAASRQTSAAFRAGNVTILCSQPLGPGGRASRYLAKHPDGIGTVIFEVEDAQRALELIEARGGTPINDVQHHENGSGRIAFFSIATPFGDSTFRFVERQNYTELFPGFEMYSEPAGPENPFGFGHIDHITSNFETMSPALLWLEHVLGFERYWDVQFHTSDVVPERKDGSGLRSSVFWDPHSGVKFANNEPMRPFFRSSQINIFHEDQRGDGIQHAALAVDDIIAAVRGMREREVEFMPTPGTYYDMLPARLDQQGVGSIDEDIDVLRELEILVDGSAPKAYLLQIFLQDSAGLYKDPEAGPFFFEVIQRKGDKGFGAGNFRALFESIERAQRSEGRA